VIYIAFYGDIMIANSYRQHQRYFGIIIITYSLNTVVKT